MCQIFGFSAKKFIDITEDLDRFFQRSAKHPHGWGMACWEKGDRFSAKEPVRAKESRYLKYILNSCVIAKLAIGHIRFATRGKQAMKNTHPFSRVIKGKQWYLIHNGTLDIKKMPEPMYKAYGQTDSERILCLLASVINSGGGVVDFEELITDLSPLGKMNIMFTCGRELYVYRNGGTLYRKQERGRYYVSTVPLDKGVWQPFPKGRLIAVYNGREVYRSRILHNLSKQLSLYNFDFEKGGGDWTVREMMKS